MRLYQSSSVKKLILLLITIILLILSMTACTTYQFAKKPTGTWKCDDPKITIEFGVYNSSYDSIDNSGYIYENGTTKPVELLWRYQWKGYVLRYITENSYDDGSGDISIGTFRFNNEQFVLTDEKTEREYIFYPVKETVSSN